MNAQAVPGLHLLIPVTPGGRLRNAPLFQVEEQSTSLTRAGLQQVSTHGWQWSPGLHSRSPLPPPLTSPLCVALPSSFLNDCGSCFVPLIRQVAPEKKKPNNKKETQQTHRFLSSSPPYKLFLNICGYDSSNQALSGCPVIEPISSGCLFLSAVLVTLDTRTLRGERRAQQVATAGVQRLQVLK